MGRCPNCGETVKAEAETLRETEDTGAIPGLFATAGTPARYQYVCPECDVILGVSEGGP